MKREQLEKIARAALALREALGVESMSASKSSYGGERVTLYPDNDEDLQAICGAFHQSPETCRVPRGWWLFANIDLDGCRVHLVGPTHREGTVELDEAKVCDAVVQAENAIGGGS